MKTLNESLKKEIFDHFYKRENDFIKSLENKSCLEENDKLLLKNSYLYYDNYISVFYEGYSESVSDYFDNNILSKIDENYVDLVCEEYDDYVDFISFEIFKTIHERVTKLIGENFEK